MNAKHRQFINEYLTCWNATEAYRRVYQDASEESARRAGQRLLTNVDIAAAVQERIDEKAMTADEVLARLAEHGRGDLGEFLSDSGGAISVDLKAMRQAGKTHLIKKITQTNRRRSFRDGSDEEEIATSLELYDAQAAVVHLGKYHRLFVERNEVKVDDALDDAARTARLVALFDAARERRDRQAAEQRPDDMETIAGATD